MSLEETIKMARTDTEPRRKIVDATSVERAITNQAHGAVYSRT